MKTTKDIKKDITEFSRVEIHEDKAVFRSGRKQTVGFIRSLRHQIINHDPDIGLIPPKDEWGQPQDGPRGIDPRNQTKPCGFFVPGSPANLARNVKTLVFFKAQSLIELRRSDCIVFDLVSIFQNLGVL